MMAKEGRSVQTACRLLGRLRVGLLRAAAPVTLGTRGAPRVADRRGPRGARRFAGDLRQPAGARRGDPRPRHRSGVSPDHRTDAPRGLAGCDGQAQRSARLAPWGHGRRPGRPPVRPNRPQPALGHRHHRAPHTRGQGLLRGRARRVLPTRRWLVDRFLTHLGAGDQRPRHGPRRSNAVRAYAHP